jgi:CRP/FNR family transcriptional regulator, nitrogen fixation regulation protein
VCRARLHVSIVAIFLRTLAAMLIGPTAGSRCLSEWFAMLPQLRCSTDQRKSSTIEVLSMIPSTIAKPTVCSRSNTITCSNQRSSPLHATIESMGTVVPYGRGREIYRVNESPTHFYEVISGTVRTSKLLEDGRRQIGSFYSAGEVFGLDVGDAHAFSAEAISECNILAVNRRTILSLASRNRIVARELWLHFAIELEETREHMMLLMKTAQERVAVFLLQMAKRSASGPLIELAMPRRDIADYLGVTIETVSRTLTQLARRAIIEIPTSRQIVLRKHAALSRLVQ